MSDENECQLIVELYKQGKSYREIREMTGFNFTKISKNVRGMRTLKQARKISLQKGRWKLTEQGRMSLSKNGINSSQKTGKYYTKPEIMFKEILNEVGVGVKFPDYIKEIKGVQDDCNDNYVLYQYPIQRYVVDFADVNKKIVININGDYWHANPLLYYRNNLGKLQQINVRQDKNKKIFLEKTDGKLLIYVKVKFIGIKSWF